MGNIHTVVSVSRLFYGLAVTHVSDLPRIAGPDVLGRWSRSWRLIFEGHCPIEYKLCASIWCSKSVPTCHSVSAYLKGASAPVLFLLLIACFGERSSRLSALTLPAGCYAILLIIGSTIKSLFFSWRIHALYEVINLISHSLSTVALLLYALSFGTERTEADKYVRFSRLFTVWICTLQISLNVIWWFCLVQQIRHATGRHQTNKSLRLNRERELHRVFKDIRQARYGPEMFEGRSVPAVEGGDDLEDDCVYSTVGDDFVDEAFDSLSKSTLPHFIRCTCCFDDTSMRHKRSDDESGITPMPSLERRRMARDAFLARSPWQHLASGGPSESLTASRLHSLCETCQWICCTSQILQARELSNPVRHFSPHIRERESYEHHASVLKLQKSAEEGCHLCCLVWDSLSPGQQQSLLKADEGFQQAQDRLSSDSGANKGAERGIYHRIRRTRLVVETFQGAAPPIDSSLKVTHSLWPDKSSAQIIPHFGRYGRPRSWMRALRDFPGRMSNMMSESDYAQPILVLQKGQREAGPIAMPLSDSTGSPMAMSLIKSWLNETEDSMSRASNFVPSRLIDVNQSLSKGTVRIMSQAELLACQRHQTRPRMDYVALSHCWGKSPTFMKLTIENEQQMRHGVGIHTLSRTFQDAVQTVACQGIRFLWIDSLCIVQNDPEDWRRESKLMCDVYKNATMTIVAAAAWGGDEGLFRTQSLLSQHPCVLGARPGKTTYAIPSRMDVVKTRRRELEMCNWNRRGWCLQERVMSRRLVFFGETQLHFECKSVLGDEGILQSQADERAYFKPNRYRPETRLGRENMNRMWWEHINSYTQRSLTYQSDKPMAVQGLAMFMEETGLALSLHALRLQIDCWGCTSSEFVASLLWYVDKGTTRRPVTDFDRFPTWSWMCVDGVIYNDSSGEVHGNSTCAVIGFEEPSHDTTRDHTRADELAVAIVGLGLKVSGRLRKATWSRLSPPEFYFARRAGVDALCACPPGYRAADLEYVRRVQDRTDTDWLPYSSGRFEYLDMVRPVSVNPEMGPRAHTLQTHEGLAVGWVVPDTTEPLPEDIYCLQIRVEPDTLVEKHKLINTWAVRGLALRRVDRGAPNASKSPVYSRVGYFELNQTRRGPLHSDFSFDWKFTAADRKVLRTHFLRELPDVDPTGFFEDAVKEEFVIE